MHQQQDGESDGQCPTRLTNQLILRFLESQVPPSVFKDILAKVQNSIDLPTHVAWDGSEVHGTFDELKVSQQHLDAQILPELVGGFIDPKKVFVHKNNLTQYINRRIGPDSSMQVNLFAQLHQQIGRFKQKPKRNAELLELSKLERVKTVFCHADFQTDEVSSIFNVQFDQTGSLIVSGADDGIIKVWDRDTLTLQASLHGHSDYITIMDVSKCNQYIVTAGKDAKIIAWELSTGQMIQKLEDHQAQINWMQFYAPNKGGQEQFLLSCSDDGTVRLYDFSPLSQTAKNTQSSETDQFLIRRSSRQRQSTQSNQKPLYTIELSPNDFRPGMRNKKLETLAVNHAGLVVAGTNTGDMFVWRINYEFVTKRQPKQDCHRFIGQFKIHKNSGISFCEFSPKNGQVGIGDMLMTGSTDGVVKVWKMNVSSWSKGDKNLNMEDKDRLMIEIDETNGCLVTKEIHNPDQDLKEYIQEPLLAQGSMLPKQKYSKSQCEAVRWSVNGRFAICSITSSVDKKNDEECHIKIFDTVDQVFYDDLARHSGLMLKKNTWVLAPHPFYEEILMTGSDGGMLILWNICQKQVIKKFQQNGVYSIDAYVMDNPLDGKWSPDGKAFVVGNKYGTIALYSCEINKFHQYEATRVQQFFQFDMVRQTDNPFCKVTERPQICGYNMVPYEVQPVKPLIRFQPDQLNTKQFERRLMLGKELGKLEEKYYQDQVITSLNILDPGQRIESFNESLIPQTEIIDDDGEATIINALTSPQRRPQRARVQQNSSAPRQTRARLQRNNQTQIQLRAESQNVVYVSDEDAVQNSIVSSESEEQIQSDPSSSYDSENSDDRNRRNVTRIAQLNRPNGSRARRDLAPPSPVRTRRRNISLESSILSYQDSEEEQKQPHGNRRNRKRIMSSSDEEMSEEQPRTRNKKSGRVKRGKFDDDFELDKPEPKGQTCYLSDNEIKYDQKPETFTSHMMITAQKYVKQKSEVNYDLVQEIGGEKICHLCNRRDNPLVGPFQKSGGPLIYFHKECVEVNTYSYYKVKEQRWVNIESMLKHLQEDAQYTCFRCNQLGASVSCVTCGRNFHGFQCASFYMINLGQQPGLPPNCEGVNTEHWQCLICRNTENFENFQSAVKNQKNYTTALKKIDRSHLLLSEQSSQYVPQLDDIVYYFFQGHENFIYQYNCHFFAGQKQFFPVHAMMPWLLSNIKKTPLVLCRVVSLQTLFPSERSLALIEEFGQISSSVTQVPQIIQRLQLQILQGKDANKIFVVELFPNELPDFIIPQQFFKQQLEQFNKQNWVGKQVKIQTKTGMLKVNILSQDEPYEPCFSPDSLWLNIVCSKSTIQSVNQQNRSTRNAQSEEQMRINFWDIVFDQPIQPAQAFSQIENQKLQTTLQTFMQKKKEYLVYFKDRVDEKFARDYRVIVAQEMWFELLLQRVQNNYYRSSTQFLADLEQISTNATQYNGATHEVAVDAKEIVQKVRQDLVKFINDKPESKIKQQIQEAGKLTAPTRLKTDAELIGQYEQLKRNRVQIEEIKEQEPRSGKRKRNEENRMSEEENPGRQLRNKRQRVI